MNNEMRDKVIKIVTDVYDRQAQICESADEIIDLVEAALTQQQEDYGELQRHYHLLASEMVYEGNSVQHWRQKALAYKECAGVIYELKSLLGVETPADVLEQVKAQRQEAEPVVYQSRMRPEFDRYHAWTPWENCSKGKYEDIKRVPVNAGWIFEARALYLHPPKPAAQPKVPEGMLRVELALSDRSISRLIPVAQIETSNTNEVERYANQCWRELSAAKEEGK